MKKLIELGVAIDTAIDAADEYDGGYNFERERKIRDSLMALPTVDAVPVVHGRWIYHPDWQADGECGYECSECGMGSDVDYQFCMRCGAKMDGKDGDGNG